MNELGNDEIRAFLQAIDDELMQHAAPGETLAMHLIGSAALILRYGLRLATKDVDIVHFHESALEGKAIALFGKGDAECRALGLLP